MARRASHREEERHMVLVLVAELLGGATLVSPGGPLDTETAAAEEVLLWASVTVHDAVENLELEGTPVPVGAVAEPSRV
jgi:hypothetical protein